MKDSVCATVCSWTKVISLSQAKNSLDGLVWLMICFIEKILVLWLMWYFTSAADCFIWGCRGISILNSLKEVEKMMNSAFFRHCVSIILRDRPDPWQRCLTNEQHTSFEAPLWNSVGKSFSSLLLMALAVSLAICFSATDNIKLDSFFLMQHQDCFCALFYLMYRLLAKAVP